MYDNYGYPHSQPVCFSLGKPDSTSALSKSMNTALPSTNGSTQRNGDHASSGNAVRPVRTRDPLSFTQDDGGRVKLALFGRPIPELLGYARLLHNSMEGNEFFPEPRPPQDDLASAIADAHASMMRVLNLKSQLAAELALRDDLVDKLTLKLDQRGNYVQMASGGNSVRILSAGIEVRRDRRPVQELDVPAGLCVELNGTAGVAALTWSKVKNARMYMIEYGPVDGPYVQRPVPGRRKVELDNLPIGEMYQFRVCAMGGATGQSYWSPWVKRGIG
jgi:hypothetical protein